MERMLIVVILEAVYLLGRVIMVCGGICWRGAKRCRKNDTKEQLELEDEEEEL